MTKECRGMNPSKEHFIRGRKLEVIPKMMEKSMREDFSDAPKRSTLSQSLGDY